MAFACSKRDNPAAATRSTMRKNWKMLRLTRRIVSDIQQILDPDGRGPDKGLPIEDDGVIHLWSPEMGALAAGVNYASIS